MLQFRSLFLALALLAASVIPSFAVTTVPAPVNIGLRDVINTVEQSFSSANRYDAPDNDIFLVDLTADFFQRSTLAKNNREMRADGQFYLKNADYQRRDPLMFRFDYYRPTTHEIVSDGSTLWTYLPENRQVIVSDMTSFFDPDLSDPARNSGFNFLQGLSRISKDFEILFSQQGRDMDGNYILELTPRRAMETIEKLFVVVRFESVRRFVQNGRRIINPAYKNNRRADLPRPEWAFPILSTTVIDHQGNSTTLEFSNIRANVGLTGGLFRFDIPADVQAVRPPGSR